MLPKKTLDKINCLESLVGIRSECKDIVYPFYLEDLEGVDIKSLASLATVNSPSGVSFGKDIINRAAREMMADIDLLIQNGFSLQDTFGSLCGACDYVLLYQTNAGIKVTNTIVSNYSLMQISRIEMLTNFTGNAVLVIDDSITPVQYDVVLQNGVIVPANLSYQTDQKKVNIYFTNAAIGLANISCKTASGCGCGGASNRAAKDTIRYSGLLAGMDTTTQYGFKVCANIVCSSDLMVCELMKQMPNIFGITLLYKAGQKYYSDARNSTRNNRVAGQDNEQKELMSDYFARLYNKNMTGTKQTKSIRTTINNYLKQRTDKCIICDGLTKIGYAAG